MFLTTPNPSLGRAKSCKVLQGPVSVETGCGETPSLGVAARGSAALLPISCSCCWFLNIIIIPNRLSVVRSGQPGTVPSRAVQSEWPLRANLWDRSARPFGHLLWPALHDRVVNAPPGIRPVHNATAMKRTLHLELSLFCGCRIELTPVVRALLIRLVANETEPQAGIVVLIDHQPRPIERGHVRSGDDRCHRIICPGLIAL